MAEDGGLVDPARVLVVGAGDLGRRVFHGLVQSRTPRIVRLLGRDEDAVVREVNLARMSALQVGLAPDASYAVADLDDHDRTAEEIDRFRPDLVFAAASRQSWWVSGSLAPDAFARLAEARFGPWLPMHLAPVANLMRAVRLCDSRAVVVNAAYPDVVHPVLASAGLSPDVGIGNVANNVPALRIIAAARIGRQVADVKVRFVAHHYVSHRVSRHGATGNVPFSLTVECDGADVTSAVGIDTIFEPLSGELRRPGGRAGQAMTAASALSVLQPLADGTSADVHAPAPFGLPGGYPVSIKSRRVVLDLPASLSRDEAIAINEEGQLLDGIADITDGWVRFAEPEMEVMRRELGYCCDRMHWTEAADRAGELAARYAGYRESAS